MAKSYIHEIPEGYEARIEGNKVIIELAESEDERVREWLFNLFDSRHSNFVEELDNYNGNVTRKEILAYLEKQKECVADNSKTSADEDERIRNEIIDHLVKEVGLYPGEDRKEHRWLRWLEKQKEQKPKMPPKWLYRLEYKDASCGLWYNGKGKWCFESGIGAVDGCKTKTLPMDYDERYKQDGRDWFSSCSQKEDLLHWYSLEDAKKLISKGFVFTRYLATEYHEYDQQTVFIKETSLYREEIDIFELFKQKPVEIDEEINRWMGCEAFPEGTNITPLPQAMEIVERTAKHFFELGEKTVPSPGGYWEGFKHGVRECQAKIRDVKDTMKEQKPAESPSVCIESEHDKGYREGVKYALGKTEQYTIGSTFMGLIPCWVNAPSELQSAHKYHGKNAVIMHENNGGFRCCFIDDKEATTVHLPEDTMFVEGWRKKPAEWSEEDEDNLNRVIRVLEDNDSDWKELTDWLKSLPLNLKKKNEDVAKLYSIEWGEEEEKSYKELIHHFESLSGCLATEERHAENRRWLSFLKSLRPSWKPSEEQMKHLQRAISCYESDWGENKLLRSLIYDLKNMM